MELLIKYRIPSMGEYSQPGSELCSILRRLDKNSRLNEIDKTWIKNKGMFNFYKFLENWEKNKKPNFNLIKTRYLLPKDIAKKDSVIQYAKKYDIDIKYPNSRLYKIFQYIKKGKRFLKEDMAWLIRNNFLDKKRALLLEYHYREAEYYKNNYSKSKNLWDIVNASSHYRKAKMPEVAIPLVDNIVFKKIKSNSLKSALIVTQGGAYRDLLNLDKALENANKGFNYDSLSFHPCTLLGAVYYQMRKFSLGDKWYARAVKNGATVESVDSEIRAIYKSTKGKEREEFKRHLLNIDSCRYHWVHSIK